MSWTAGGSIAMDLALAALWLGTFAAQATLLGVGWRGYRRHWAAITWLGPAVLLLQLPNIVLTVSYLDVMALGPDFEPEYELAARVGAGVVAAVLAIWGAMFAAASVPPAIAWWASVRVVAWPRRGRARQIEGFWVGLIGGAIASVVSMAGLVWFEVGEGEVIVQMREMFTGIEGAPWWVLGPALASLVAVYGVTEEITYRGLLLPALWRLFGRGEWAFWLATALVSLAWALMHVPNTDRPDLKVLQIFVLGIGLGWLTRRYGLKSAIAAHVGLNVAAVALEMGLMR